MPREYIQLIVQLINACIALIGALLAYSRYFLKPDLHYRVLQPYKTSEKAVFGIEIDNTGHKIAKNVRVKIETNEQLIRDIRFEGFLKQPDLEEGGVGSPFVTFCFDRLSPHTCVVVYITTDKFVKPQVYVDTEEGVIGRPADIAYARRARFLETIGLATIIYIILTLCKEPVINFLQKIMGH